MPELECFILHRLHELDALVRKSCDAYDFHTMFTALHNFCAVELSSFYFDIRKDALYCDDPADPRRRAARTVMAEIFSCLTAWLAPIICFTAEEAWQHRNSAGSDDGPDSVHLRQFPDLPAEWQNAPLAEKWQRIRTIRRVVTGALELERAAKRIGASLQASVTVYLPDADVKLFDGLDVADICITSDAVLTSDAAPEDVFRLDEVAGIAVSVAEADGRKCERCWKVLPEVGQQDGHDDLCRRCAEVVGG